VYVHYGKMTDCATAIMPAWQDEQEAWACTRPLLSLTWAIYITETLQPPNVYTKGAHVKRKSGQV